MLRAETDTVVVDVAEVVELASDCPGRGRCHGCMGWCDRCGDVDEVCDAAVCDAHRCQRCHQIRKDRDQERDHSYVCYVCAPADYPHRWPALLVFSYAIELPDWSWSRDHLVEDLEAGIARITHGDCRRSEYHPRELARRLGLDRVR